MAKANQFIKLRFLEYGKPAKSNSIFKSKINQKSIFGNKGWFEYTCRKDAIKLSDLNILEDVDNSNDEMIMSSDGLLYREKIAQFKTKCKDNFNKDGQILWDCVVSLSSFEYAEKCGLLNHSDYASVVAKVLPKFYKTIGLDPNNMLWWETYHANTNNPHMHICFFEKIKQDNEVKLSKVN